MAVYGLSRPLSVAEEYGLWLNLQRQVARMTAAYLEALQIHAGKSCVQPLHYEALGYPAEAAEMKAWEVNRARADERHIANPAHSRIGPPA